MPQLIKYAGISLSIATFLFAGLTSADGQTQMANQQAALEACADLATGDVCSFTNASGEATTGVCDNNTAGQLSCISYQVN